jgi:hypothetical protein
MAMGYFCENFHVSNGEFRRIWKKASQHLPGVTEEYYGKPQSGQPVS